jgi:hypothetical protein
VTGPRSGRILSGVLVFLLMVDAYGKLAGLPPVVEGTVRLGYPANLLAALGLIELLCAIVYAIPRTAALGAILLTGFLGGATATHVRIGDPFVFPIVSGILIWGALFLREGRLRALIPLRS